MKVRVAAQGLDRYTHEPSTHRSHSCLLPGPKPSQVEGEGGGNLDKGVNLLLVDQGLVSSTGVSMG